MGQRSRGVSRQLHKGVHGVDWRRSLRTLVAFCRVFFLLPAVLADERAILVELAVSSLAIIHQAVVTVVLLDRPIGWGPAAFQGLVILRVTDVKSRDKGVGKDITIAQFKPSKLDMGDRPFPTCCLVQVFSRQSLYASLLYQEGLFITGHSMHSEGYIWPHS